MKTSNGYTRLQIGLHWAIAVLIVTAWFISDDMGKALRARIEAGDTGFANGTVHGMVGFTVFVLVLIRIIVRFASGAPAATPETSARMALAAKWGHRLIYVLMLAVPAAGMGAWFGHVTQAGELHETLANALMIVAGGHAALAIYHHAVMKDGTLDRMRKPAS